MPPDFQLPTFRQQLRALRAHLAGTEDAVLLDPQAGCVLRFTLPHRLEDLWDRACRACGVLYGALPSVDTCIQTFLEAFFEEHVEGALDSIREHPILDRDGWRCQVPTCGRRAPIQDHHLHFRSRGGGNQPWNRSSVCTQHHLHGIHEGRIRAHGRAPDDITWELGVRPDGSAHLTVHGRTIVEEGTRAEACA